MEAKASEVRQSLKSIFLFYFNRFPNFPCYRQNMFKVNCNDSTEAVVTDVLQSIDFVKIYRKIPHATLNRLITNPSPMYLVRLEIYFYSILHRTPLHSYPHQCLSYKSTFTRGYSFPTFDSLTPFPTVSSPNNFTTTLTFFDLG